MRSPGPDPEVISVPALLRREGLHAPRSANGRLRRRGTPRLPFPDPVEPNGRDAQGGRCGINPGGRRPAGPVALDDGLLAPRGDQEGGGEAFADPAGAPAHRTALPPTVNLATALVDMSGVLEPLAGFTSPWVVGRRPPTD